MRLVWLLVALSACKQGTGDDYPIIPGGDDSIFTPMADAAPADGTTLGDGSMLTGRVCLITDLRTPAACADTGAADIAVELGTATAMTADDGAFMMLAPSGTNLVWRTSKAGLVSSAMPFSTSAIVPMIASDGYAELEGANGVILNSGEGSVVLYVQLAGTPLSGATVTVAPAPTYLSMGDTGNPLVWVEGVTGSHGVSWIPGAAAGSVVATVTVGGAAAMVLTLPVDDGAITFATATFP